MAALPAAPAAHLGFSVALSSPLQPALQSRTPIAPALPAVRSRLRFVRQVAEGRRVVRVNSASAGGSGNDSGASSKAPPAAKKMTSILCQSCDGNGAVACTQCHGGGLNTEDHFGGRFKTGQTCWLCRGKRQLLCGDCNGAGFMGGFMNTQDE